MNIAPSDPIRLSVIYQENGIGQTGKTDIKCLAINQSGTVILSEAVMTENPSVDSEYYRNWNTTSISNTTFAVVIYKKGTSIIGTENIFFETIEDMDGVAM